MMDWTAISLNPTEPKALEAISDYLSSISRIVNRPWNCPHPTFSQFCDQYLFTQFNPKGPLLDIGLADHTCDPNSPAWRHGRLSAVVENCCGIDLNRERVETIRKVTSLERLCVGNIEDNPSLPFQEFSGIFAGDVIEHMDNPGELMRFIRRHLSATGLAIITTPNCYGRKAMQVRKNGTVIDNLEHTSWFSPFQINELCRRHQICLRAILYFREGRKRLLAQAIAPALKALEHRMRDNWVDSYSYILSHRI
jgi:SAM-dependent methyltransferase